MATLRLLEEFGEAFNRHDLDGILVRMTDDCEFLVSVGPEPEGQRHVGQEAVRAGVAEVFAAFPDGRWEEARHFLAGDRGVSEWLFRGTKADGTNVVVRGCDLFTFREGKIWIKDSYRKSLAF